VVEAALAEHVVEWDRLEGRAQHQRLIGAQPLHRGHDPPERLLATADVLAQVEVHAARLWQIRELAGPSALTPARSGDGRGSVRGEGRAGAFRLAHRAPQHAQQLVRREARHPRGLRHRDPGGHHPAEQSVPELLEVRVVARQHLDQLGVLVEQPGHRHVRRDHAGAFPTPFSAVSSVSSGTPADAAASRSVSWAPQQ